jgi:hypothetical protein
MPMNANPDPAWPPSLEALGPPEQGISEALDDPIGPMRRQHREMARLLSDLAGMIASPFPDPQEEPAWRRRLRSVLGKLNRFLENHRDMEESIFFPHLLDLRTEIGASLDDLADEHIQIFRENRALNLLLDQLDLEESLTQAQLAELIPALRTFLERLWRHTLTEEKLLAGLRASAS